MGSKLGALTAEALAVLHAARTKRVVTTSLALMGGPMANLSSVMLAALFAGSAGGAVGGALGKLADQSFLDDHKCLDCGFTFRADGDEMRPFGQPPAQGPAGPRFQGDVDHFYAEDR